MSTPDGIYFTINADHDNYVCVGIMSNDLPTGMKTKAKSFFKTNHKNLNLEDCDNWIFYKFIDFENSDGLYLSDFYDELTFSLISETRRNEVVDIIIKQIIDLLNSYSKHIK